MCSEFIQLDFSDGPSVVKKQLPLDIQTKWDKFGKRHQEQHHRHPEFIRFIEFLGSQVRQATYVGYQTIAENPEKSSLKFKTLQTTVTSTTVDTVPNDADGSNYFFMSLDDW